MFATLAEFLTELTVLVDEFFPESQLRTVYSRIDRISLRLILDAALFVDIYFSVGSDRFDFSLIQSGKRVFGYDNLKSWHFHPFGNADRHISCSEPDLRHVVEQTAQVVTQLRNR